MRIILISFAWMLLGCTTVNNSTNHITKFTVEATIMTNASGKMLANGEKNYANTEVFAALPSRKALGRRITVFCPQTNKTINNIPIKDVGSWSTNDDYWNHGTRPKSESGISNKHKKVTNKSGIDISLALAEELGLQYPWKGEVTWSFEK